MNDNDSGLRGNYKSKPILPSLIDVAFIKEIVTKIQEAHKTALQLIKSSKPSINSDLPPDQDEHWSDYKVGISFQTKDGQLTLTDPSNAFNEGKLPDDIQRVSINNINYYLLRYQRQPPFAIEVVFDFRKPPFFDLTINPTHATPNESHLMVAGNERTWVEGVFSDLSNMIDRRKSYSWLLHGKNIYDGVLWLLIFPLLMWNMSKFDKLLINLWAKQSTVFIAGVYIYITIISLFAFRMVFDYLRWVFPYMQLENIGRGGSRAHKIVLLLIIMGIAIAAIYDLLCGLISLIF